jgi:hypothetical protein
VTNVGLLGLRFGASVAGIAAARRTDITTLILWAPIIDGERYVQELLRINLTTQMAVYKEIRIDRAGLIVKLDAGETVNVDGYEISRTMYEQLCTVKLDKTVPFPHARCLVIQVDRNSDAPRSAEISRLAEQWPHSTVVVAQEQPFWKEIKEFYQEAPDLFARTRQWLEQE